MLPLSNGTLEGKDEAVNRIYYSVEGAEPVY